MQRRACSVPASIPGKLASACGTMRGPQRSGGIKSGSLRGAWRALPPGGRARDGSDGSRALRGKRASELTRLAQSVKRAWAF